MDRLALLPLLAQAGSTSGFTALSGHFKLLDWAVLIGYLALVSVLGVLLAGRQKNMDDFFRGGNRLPWYAVSASFIATAISAVTFVGVPAVAFAGNMTYLQLGIIAGLISRVFVAWILVPAYYKHRVYSPYDYMGMQLGAGVKGITTALFSLGGLLAQSARVYLTAVVLQMILSGPLGRLEEITGISGFAWAIILIGVVSIAWTMLGGIATVVWTDAMLFLVFVIGGVIALVVVIMELPGGFSQFVQIGSDADKFRIFDLGKAFSLTDPYTLAAAGFAVVISNIGVYGTDQLLAQRIFCCKDVHSARLAVVTSYAGELVAALMLLVGVGLYAFYTTFPEKLSGAGALAAARENDKIFPVFILEQIPPGLTGLIVAGIFAAAISSLTSILAALAQTTVSAVYLPMRARTLGVAEGDEQAMVEQDPAEGRRLVRASRWLIALWGVLLCVGAFAVDAYKSAAGVPILDLALALASYIVGGLFAAFLLAWLPLKINGRGLVWSAPLGVLAVVAVRFHEAWTYWAVGGALAVLLVAWVIGALRTSKSIEPGVRARRLVRTGWLLLACALILLLVDRGYFHVHDPVTGQVVMEHPPLTDSAGKPVPDPDAPPVYLKHPITGEPLAGADGGPILAAQQTYLRDASRARPTVQTVAWPWYAPLGAFVAFVFGYLLADRRERTAE